MFKMSMTPLAISDRLKATPTLPGVYLMRNAEGNVIYVGKAANLRSRLRSYFGSLSNLEPRVRNLVASIADFEYTVAETGAEALLLENTLIKRYKPRYNARLKDDKTYPYIKIDLNEDFPQLYFTRRIQNDKSRYFGPFASAGSVRTTMALLKKLFPYRSCTKVITGKDPRPCLEYYINRCAAPCIGIVNRDEYREIIDQVIMFMEGKTDQVLRDLNKKMRSASEGLQFERAAALRDQIRAIERVNENQKVVSQDRSDQDAIAFAVGGDEAWVEVFFVRQGKLTGRDHFIMEGVREDAPPQIMETFIKQFYDTAPHVPREVLLQHNVDKDKPVIEEWLGNKRGTKVKLLAPQRGAKRRLVQMVADNAAQGLQQRAVKWLSDTNNLQQAMNEVGEALSLPRLPSRMECYDISNIQGSNPVGSMVVFEEGRPKNGHYRRFRIKSVEGVDDYSMMQEMLRRRFRKLGEQLQRVDDHADPDDQSGSTPTNGQRVDGETWGIIPDLVLIDGGRGHLSAALQVFLELGLVDRIAIASLAKEREELFLPHDPDPIVLPKGSQGLFLVQRIRDEAHRFAVTYHRQRRSRGAVKSLLDSVPGVGPKKRRMLIQKFGSVAGVKAATLPELAEVPGVNMALAERIKEHLG